MSDLHCPANLSSIAGESNSGLRDGRKSLFQNPSLLCIYTNLIFVCDSGNASISVIDISRLVSRKKNESRRSNDSASTPYSTALVEKVTVGLNSTAMVSYCPHEYTFLPCGGIAKINWT